MLSLVLRCLTECINTSTCSSVYCITSDFRCPQDISSSTLCTSCEHQPKVTEGSLEGVGLLLEEAPLPSMTVGFLLLP